MLGFLNGLQQRTPLGLKQLKHDPLRLLTAIAGITFADILIFMQLGFADALYTSNTQYPRALQADLVLISSEAKNFGQLGTFTRRRLYQSLDVPGVASADALYLGSTQWRNPQTNKETSMLVVGQNPEHFALDLPVVNAQLDTIQLPDTVLFDQASRGDYQAMITQVQAGEGVRTEIGLRTVEVGGLFEVGASFADDGALITSDQNFLRLFSRRDAGAISVGLIRLDAAADPVKVQAVLRDRLPQDVHVFTHEEYIDFELNDIQSESPIGFVFGLGSAMGFIVGVVIVYQVLSTDVNSHLGEYATFRAMGYRNSYLLGIVFEEALILSVLGFIPGL
ncbi:MAG: ABC transporter permease DevC, partial [Cyanobacteria bacterium J06639_14]